MELFSKIFGINSPGPSKLIRQGFEKHYAGARNIEWTNHKEFFEAIFYDNDIEKIARFDCNGQIIESRINIVPCNIPQLISSSIGANYEIMNCIAVHTNNAVNYELIVRDKALTRILILVDAEGKISGKEEL